MQIGETYTYKVNKTINRNLSHYGRRRFKHSLVSNNKSINYILITNMLHVAKWKS